MTGDGEATPAAADGEGSGDATPAAADGDGDGATGEGATGDGATGASVGFGGGAGGLVGDEGAAELQPATTSMAATRSPEVRGTQANMRPLYGAASIPGCPRPGSAPALESGLTVMYAMPGPAGSVGGPDQSAQPICDTISG